MPDKHGAALRRRAVIRNGMAMRTPLAAAVAVHAPPGGAPHAGVALSLASALGGVRTAALLLGGLYVGAMLALLISRRAQGLLVYLHWLRPPTLLAPLDTLKPYRLDAVGRVVTAGHLRGWHLLPPGPPFAPPTDPGDGRGVDPARELFFDEEMRRLPNTRVVIFFHGNSGTRAFPFKRIDTLRLLGSGLNAHVVTFDYTGFGDSPGRPSEDQLYEDAYNIYKWVADRTSDSAQIILYGQSLGTFAASHLASTVCPHIGEDGTTCLLLPNSVNGRACHKLRAVVLDAPPASLYDASMSHASAAIFRTIPFMRRVARAVLHETHDSVKHCGRIAAPLLIVHGEKDSLIPIEQGRRIHAAAVEAGNRHAFFTSFPDAGHNDVNAASNYLLVLNEFVSKFVEPTPCRAPNAASNLLNV
jgi:pimeloyl-ACP methyl ester carboxylesterase